MFQRYDKLQQHEPSYDTLQQAGACLGLPGRPPGAGVVACVPGDTDAAGDAFARKTPQSPELYRSSVADSLALCGADSAPKRWLAASPLSQCALRSHVLCACAVLCVCVCVCVCVRACVRGWARGSRQRGIVGGSASRRQWLVQLHVAGVAQSR
jgi:hypothetical protein